MLVKLIEIPSGKDKLRKKEEKQFISSLNTLTFAAHFGTKQIASSKNKHLKGKVLFS